jgi:dihydropteroate synthase
LAALYPDQELLPASRDNATVAATTAAVLAGASIVRVHNVRLAAEAVRIADAILNAAGE